MCSEGVSVWFACKLCPSFFLNADDFAYHKKKSHIGEFRNTKFIVFEEQQTTPPVSPPENWVSFLSPKEETRIHKIISSPVPSPSTATSLDFNLTNENIIQNNRNEECIEIDSERNKNLNDHCHNSNNESDDAGEVPTNNCVELSSNLILNDEADQENYKNQSNVASTSTSADSHLTDEKRDKICSSGIKATISKRKSNSLRRRTRTIVNVLSKTALLQSVIQSRNNPFVYLERLNLITIQNAPAPSNSTIPSQKNDKSGTNHNNSDAKSPEQPNVKCENQENIIQRSSTLPSPPTAAVENCKFCYENFNSTPELESHEDICRSKIRFKNSISASSFLTFDSSDKLNSHNHNQALHFTSISKSTPEATKCHQPHLGDELEVEVASRNEIQSDFLPGICNKSRVNELSLPSNHGGHVYNTDFIQDFELGAVSNADNNGNLVPDPTTEVVEDLNFGPVLEIVKTEYVTPRNEDGEFPDDDRDPFESLSQTESSAELTPNVAASSSSSSERNHEKLSPQTDTSRYCISCQKEFISYAELKAHNRSSHGTQYGNKTFKCPHPNCGTTARDQYTLKLHVVQVHSDARPYNCPYPNCTMSFKIKHSRRMHMKRVHRKTSSSCHESNRLETEPTNNEGVSHSNHFATEPEPELTPQTDSFRYCILCKKYFVSLQELRHHHKMYHTTQEGRRLFSCPYPNCATKTKSQGLLKSHLIHVHSNVRPFKCPHATCKMAFKTTSSRNRHFKNHAKH